VTSSKNVSRPAWWPTQEQKERADKACADAQAATATTSTAREITAPLEFVRDDYGIWSWCLYDGEEIVAMCKGFDSRQDAVEGFRKLKGLPVETKLKEAAVLNARGDQLEWSGDCSGPVKALD
jgi:hypothetical protein